MEQFQEFIFWWYSLHGRTHLPWRKNYSPYDVLVSELMLQQTQVERVIPKYEAFMWQFPNVETLAAAPLKDVLIAWQGLGYNRRAKFLHQTAQAVHSAGKFPDTYEKLLELPGVGPYTASAISAFSYNLPVNVIETNIRAVFIHHFFADQQDISDKQLAPLIEKSIPTGQARIWYSALMDYGSVLKKLLPNPTRKSKTYKKQSTFVGSVRQTRGEILKVLAEQDSLSKSKLFEKLKTKQENHQIALDQLINENLILEEEDKISFAK